MKIFNLTDARSGSPLRISNKTATEADIILYAGIGDDFWGDGSMISAKQFDAEMKKLADTTTTINVRINSPGGDVFQGMTIFNRLKQHKAKKKVYVDGMAASIASIIALAGDEIIMGEGALYMVHLPWTGRYGNRMDFENTINLLTDIEDQMIGIYTNKAKKSGINLSKTEMRALLEKETWMNADEVLGYGFATGKMEETAAIAASVFDKATWIMKKPKNFVSEDQVTKEKIKNLRKQVEARLARK